MKKFKIFLLLIVLFTLNNISFTQITSYPHSTNFASDFGDWLQSGTDDFDWTQKTSGTNSSGTGPQNAPYGANGTTGYVYTETSSPVTTNQTARIYCTYDLSGASSASITFYYHIYANSGYGPGTLRLKIYKGNSSSGGTMHYPWTVTTSHNGWQQATIDLADYIGYSYVQLAFESITPAAGSVWQCDNAIDEVEVSAVTCVNAWNGSANDGDWTNVNNWSCGVVPSSGDNITIPAGVGSYPTISSNTTFGTLTIPSGATLTVSSNTLTLNGAADIDGTLSVSGTVDANSTFDATNGTIDIPSGTLKLGSTVTSLGTLDDNSGTVEYDGGTQAVISGTYNNLIITTAGTKTANGNITINGDLTTAATSTCKLDIGSNDLTLKGAISVGAIDGLDLSDASCNVTLSGSSSQSLTHVGSTVSTIESNQTDYSIPDQSYVESTIAVSSSANASDLTSITLNITHTFTADLDITLYAPNGSNINLSSDNGGGGNNYTNTVFTSGVGTAITSGSAPFTGNYTPEVAFSNLTGTANGNWKLRITDDYSGDIGDLLDWEINISGSASGGIFKNIAINNSSGVSLSSNLEITGTLTLTSGDINTNANTLTVTTNGTISGGSASSMVIGNLAIKTNSTSSKTFPIGDGTSYRPVIITPSSSSDETYTAKFYNTAHANTTMGSGLHHVSQYYWDINRANSVNAELAFDWDAGYAVDDIADLKLAHFNSGTSEWEDMSATISGAGNSGSASNSSGRLTATATSFSPFGFGSGSSGNALPIDLISFTGEVMEEIEPVVLLEWVVASQVNNDYFTIEKSKDAYEWKLVETITGAGNSNTQISYSLIDKNVDRGVTYYRLSQTDYDGIIKSFQPIAITIKEERKEIVKRTNLMGQIVNDSYQGIVVEIWDNGDIVKRYNR
jgi:subtilisin-like proprotein convertase family protein